MTRPIRADEVELPISGQEVSLVGIAEYSGGFLRLYFWGPVQADPRPGEYLLGIDGPFSVVFDGVRRGHDPQPGPDPLYLRFVGKVVKQAIATRRGDLHVEFADGDTLTVEAVTRAVGSGGFEPWLLEGDYGYSAVSIAGGGLSVAQGPPNPGGLNPLSRP